MPAPSEQVPKPHRTAKMISAVPAHFQKSSDGCTYLAFFFAGFFLAAGFAAGPS